MIAALVLTLFAAVLPPGGTFVDDDGSPHEGYIEAIAAREITLGCNPPINDRYCPDDPVDRGAMAAFLARGLELPATSNDFFRDDDGHMFEGVINRLAAAGIAKGCNPPANDRFCPNASMTRGEMAAMLARGFEYPTSNSDTFNDDDGHLFEQDIQKIAKADVTRGCNPPVNTRFCPNRLVNRGEMATFLARAIGIAAITPPEAVLKSSGPVTIDGRNDVIVENLSISNPHGPCVRILGSSNVTLRNVSIGPCGDWGVFIDRSSRVTVQQATVRTQSSRGGIYGHSSSAIAVLGNFVSDSGRNPIQFDKVSGSGNRIENNTVASSPAEDMISIFKSGGTAGSWLRVAGNTVRDNTGESNSGSGILVGDAGGSFILVERNRLANPGQVGIGIPGGSNIKLLDNIVLSTRQPWSNVGIYVWNQSNSVCSNIEVRGNQVDWINSDGRSNPAYNGGGCGAIAGWNDNGW